MEATQCVDDSSEFLFVPPHYLWYLVVDTHTRTNTNTHTHTHTNTHTHTHTHVYIYIYIYIHSSMYIMYIK